MNPTRGQIVNWMKEAGFSEKQWSAMTYDSGPYEVTTPKPAAELLIKLACSDLQAKNAELEKEVEALTNERDLNVRQCDANTQLISQLRQQLAIAEAQNARLREAFEIALWFVPDYPQQPENKRRLALIKEALSIPASREALDKYVAEHGRSLNE